MRERAIPKHARRGLPGTAAVLTALAVYLLPACAGSGDAGSITAEAGEDRPGGDTTNAFLLGSNAFISPVENISAQHKAAFFGGDGFFNDSWVQAPSSTFNVDGLGPIFNARSCSACHFKDGRGAPPLADGEPFLGLLLRLSVPGAGEHGEPLNEPNYGGQLQPFALPNVPAEGMPRVVYAERRGTFADGASYSLLEPEYRIDDLAHGPLAADVRMSPRVAPAMVGLGLLEAIPVERLQALEDPDDADGDGISGRVHWVWDLELGANGVGRFGWKAEQPSVRQQSAAAFLGDIGITNSLFAAEECTATQTHCASARSGGSPEIPDEFLDKVALYGRMLAVPVRTRWDDERTLAGKRLFHDVGCATCHVPSHRTGELLDLGELGDQRIFPYTDLLLHDMGEELSDQRPVFDAEGSEWRTPPLWGLRFYRVVNRHDRLLHDGRARGVAEAILWHGGEAATAREGFRALDARERVLLVEFVESL